jgi:signal transduction histidine kinase
MLVNDALDGAITLALETLTRHVEEVREDFIATTIHDVQQPLSGIRGYVQLARRDLGRPDPEPVRVDEMLGHAEDAVDRLRRLLATLADATRLALGRLTIQPVATSLAALVRRAIEELGPEAGGRVRLRADSDEATTAVVDPDLLERVAANLLSNAVKYSPGGEPIDVTVRRRDDQIRLSVRDRGMGLTPEDQAGLFRRYSRTSRAVERGIEGAGLGLYLSRGIVEAHGGQIRADSAGLNQGTTIHVSLPRAAATTAPNGHDGS